MLGGMLLVLLFVFLALSVAQTPYRMPVAGVGYRNSRCFSECPLLIVLHGSGGSGEQMAARSGLHTIFDGIVAYPDGLCRGQGGWSAYPDDGVCSWEDSMRTIEPLLNLPDVDDSRIYIAGHSNGGYFTNALGCQIGGRLRGIVVLSGNQIIQSCPYRTNVLHIHNANDNVNMLQDRGPFTTPVGTMAPGEFGLPISLRRSWLEAASGSDGAVTNGELGEDNGQFTHYSARQDGLSYDYWSFDGPPRHHYLVYEGTPPGAPRGLEQNEFISAYLTGLAPSESSLSNDTLSLPLSRRTSRKSGDMHLRALHSALTVSGLAMS